MPHIELPELPGITAPMKAYPETEKYLNGLAEALLRGTSSLSPAEREVIATYVSDKNGCYFCTNAHAATARELLGKDREIVDTLLSDGILHTQIDKKLKALLDIAHLVSMNARMVEEKDIVRAREAGADDKAIHDTVLIAAAFCMFNRYVDGLATVQPQDPKVYEAIGKQLATTGYIHSIR